MALDEIKSLMAAGETVQADEALKELLAVEPNKLHDELAPVMEDELAPKMKELEEDEPKAEPISYRKKHYALWISLIAGGLVLAGIWTGICLGKDNKRAASVFCSQETQMIPMARVKEVKGRYVTGCGCGCDNCTCRWFMRDDIDYTLSWHPGKCKGDQCACPCEHGHLVK